MRRRCLWHIDELDESDILTPSSDENRQTDDLGHKQRAHEFEGADALDFVFQSQQSQFLCYLV